MSLGTHRTCEICGIQERHSASSIYFARFPINGNRCREWVKAVGKPDLIYISIEKLNTLRHVCEKHFHKKCFTRKHRLKRSAVPTLDLSAPPLSDELLKDFPLHMKKYSREPSTCAPPEDVLMVSANTIKQQDAQQCIVSLPLTCPHPEEDPMVGANVTLECDVQQIELSTCAPPEDVLMVSANTIKEQDAQQLIESFLSTCPQEDVPMVGANVTVEHDNQKIGKIMQKWRNRLAWIDNIKNWTGLDAATLGIETAGRKKFYAKVPAGSYTRV